MRTIMQAAVNRWTDRRMEASPALRAQAIRAMVGRGLTPDQAREVLAWRLRHKRDVADAIVPVVLG